MEKEIKAIKETKEFIAMTKKEFKVSNCVLCGKAIDGKCNSHSVPQFVLKELRDNSKLFSVNSVIDYTNGGLSLKGLNNCGTFHLLCPNCDGHVFSDYENKESLDTLTSTITSAFGCKIMAEIMLKSCLLEYYKKQQDHYFQDAINRIPEYEPKYIGDFSSIDAKDYMNQINNLKSIISSNSSNRFHVSCCRILDHKSKIAGQPLIAIRNDMQGKILNDVFNCDSSNEIVDTQFVVFPYNNKTLVLVYCLSEHYPKLRSFLDYLESLNGNKQLRLIQATIFSYSEEIYVNKETLDMIKNDKLSLKFASCSLEKKEVLSNLETQEMEETPETVSLSGYNKMKLFI